MAERAARHYPDKPAILFEDRCFSYREPDRAASRTAHALAKRGVETGHRVALSLPNIPAFAIAYQAVQKPGAIVVSASAVLTTDELAALLEDSGAGVVFTVEALWPRIPDVMHFFLGPRSVDPDVYPDIEEYYADLVAIYRTELEDLAALDRTALQLDDTALPCNCDETVRAEVRARGEAPDALTRRYVGLINDVPAACPAGMARSIHMCRGNLKGEWMAEGGYEPIAEAVFDGLDVDALLLEFDSPRAGDFRALRFVPAPKRVVLGLVSTKTPALEMPDELRRRIDEAARHVPLERLGLSPQC